MSTIGIIANPSAGKDIRRLVSQSRLISNQEKINILARVINGLSASGVTKILGMPDSGQLLRSAVQLSNTDVEISYLDMPILNTEIDTVNSANLMAKQGAKVLVTLGGDGTNRAVALGTCEIPLMPLSTGTNNVFPTMIEGTLAGMAAGCVASNRVSNKLCTYKSKKLIVEKNGVKCDVALVDVAISSERFVGSRAIWNISSVRELYLAIASPYSIGLSSIGGLIDPISTTDEIGLHIRLSDDYQDRYVVAPVIPGELEQVHIKYVNRIKLFETLHVQQKPCTIALDGERSIIVRIEDTARLTLTKEGPPVINAEAALQMAASNGIYVSENS